MKFKIRGFGGLEAERVGLSDSGIGTLSETGACFRRIHFYSAIWYERRKQHYLVETVQKTRRPA